MKTYDLHQAAEILHLHPDTLQRRAKAGQIKAAKPGKNWVFREEALAEYLERLETQPRQASGKQEVVWSTNVVIHGGWTSSRREVSALDAALAQRTKRQPKNCTTDSKRKAGGRNG